MTNTTHPARRLRHGDRPTEPLTFDDAAANKAAEEGGLPALLQEVYDLAAIGMCHGLSADDYCSQIVEKIAADRASRPQSYSYEQAHQYAKEAVAADRASRQVANKAEVEQDIDRFWNKAIEAEAEANRLRQENSNLRDALKKISEMPRKCVFLADAALAA